MTSTPYQSPLTSVSSNCFIFLLVRGESAALLETFQNSRIEWHGRITKFRRTGCAVERSPPYPSDLNNDGGVTTPVCAPGLFSVLQKGLRVHAYARVIPQNAEPWKLERPLFQGVPSIFPSAGCFISTGISRRQLSEFLTNLTGIKYFPFCSSRRVFRDFIGRRDNGKDYSRGISASLSDASNAKEFLRTCLDKLLLQSS